MVLIVLLSLLCSRLSRDDSELVRESLLPESFFVWYHYACLKLEVGVVSTLNRYETLYAITSQHTHER
jgi:hypothetical protein